MEEQWLSFCPFCGAAYEKRKTNPHICLSCKKEYYINPHPCNAVIMENENQEILFVRRRFPPHRGKWDLPGGFINVTETGEESVRREIREELGVELENFTYFTSYADRYLYKGVNYHTLCFFYRAHLSGEKQMKAADDITSFRYFSKDTIPYKDIAFTGIQVVLKEYIRKFPIQ